MAFILAAMIAVAPAVGIAANLPVVFWHGINSSCCEANGVGRLMNATTAVDPSIFVHSIAIKQDSEEDRQMSLIGNVNEQVDVVCSQLAAIPELSNGFNAVGISQGGLFFRAYIERCNSPSVHTFISLGSPQAGVNAAPGCDPNSNDQPVVEHAPINPMSVLHGVESIVKNCNLMRQMIKTSIYSSWVQSTIVPAQYFKDPTRISTYLTRSNFLADINNDRTDSQNRTYATHLSSIDRLVLVRFINDTVVIPRDSAWFSFPDESGTLLPLRDQPIYKEDRIGLQTLDRDGRLEFVSFPGEHLYIPDKVFKEEIVEKYLVQKIQINSASKFLVSTLTSSSLVVLMFLNLFL